MRKTRRKRGGTPRPRSPDFPPPSLSRRNKKRRLTEREKLITDPLSEFMKQLRKPTQDLELIQTLLEHKFFGLNPNTFSDEDGNSVLMIACAYIANIQIIIYILSKMTPETINHQNKKGATALTLCVSPVVYLLPLQMHNMTKLLLEHGANPNVRANNGSYPLYILMKEFGFVNGDQDGLRDLVFLFMKYEANPDMGVRDSFDFDTILSARDFDENHFIETYETLEKTKNKLNVRNLGRKSRLGHLVSNVEEFLVEKTENHERKRKEYYGRFLTGKEEEEP